jgi:hypothetical protein
MTKQKILLSVFCLAAALTQVGAATSVSQFGITWTWTEDREIGQYANGDYWVVGPITITSISPASTIVSGRTLNGTMVNPSATSYFPAQGFDSWIVSFSSAVNAGRPGGSALSEGNPLVVATGSSVVSTSSRSPVANPAHPALNDLAVLTVVASAPAAGSFRPPYQGTNKTHYWNVSQLNYSILRNLTPVGSIPSPSSAAAAFVRPWFENGLEGNSAQDIRPANNQAYYGRNMGFPVQRALLALHTDYSNAQKETLYIRCVQYGIDIYGAAKAGAIWNDNAGINAYAPKAFLVLAALALGDTGTGSGDTPNMRYFANAANKAADPYSGSSNRFAEDRQTWYVTQADVGRALSTTDEKGPHTPYIQDDVGIAEGAQQHISAPWLDGRNWGVPYRDVVYPGLVGSALAMQLTAGAKELWNWPAFFDYYDRAFGIYSTAPNATYGLADPTLSDVEAMWTAYRSLADSADTTDPAITITSPTNSATYSTTSIDVSLGGTSSDNVAVSSVTAVMTGATTGSVSITGTTTWTGSATLNAGVTTITATVTDSSGNTATDAIAITCTPEVPVESEPTSTTVQQIIRNARR